MPRKPDVAVIIKPDADFTDAKRNTAAGFKTIEAAAKESVAEIENTIEKADLSPTVDLKPLTKAEAAYKEFASKLSGRGLDIEVNDDALRKAFDLASKLENATGKLTIDTDISELKDAEKLAASLRSFTARVNLDVQGRQDLKEALGLAEQMGQIRQVKIDVQGRQDLESAERLAEGLEKKRTISLDPPPPAALDRIDSAIGEHGGSSAELFGEKFSEFNFSNVGGSAAESLAGGLAVAGPWAAAAGAVSALFGEEFAQGFNDQWNRRRDDVVRGLSSGLDREGLKKVGAAAGAAFADGLGESLSDLKDSAATLQSELGQVDKSLDLTTATKEAQVLAEVFGVEIPESTKLAQRLIANGLAPDAVSAFNLIAQAASDFGVQAQDGLEVATEFAPVFGRLGIDGAQAFKIMAAEVRNGWVPTLDRAAEQFQEFRIRLEAGDSRQAIEAIGLDFDKLQAKLTNGKGAEALANVSQRLADIGDTSQRNQRFVEIFGASVEDVTSPQGITELLATAGAVGEIGTKAQDAIPKLAGAQSSLDHLKRTAEQVGTGAAQVLDAALSGGAAGFGEQANRATLDFVSTLGGAIPPLRRYADGITEARDAQADLAKQSQAASATTAKVADSTAKMSGALGHSTESLTRVSDGWDKADGAMLRGSQAIGKVTQGWDQADGAMLRQTATVAKATTGWDQADSAMLRNVDTVNTVTTRWGAADAAMLHSSHSLANVGSSWAEVDGAMLRGEDSLIKVSKGWDQADGAMLRNVDTVSDISAGWAAADGAMLKGAQSLTRITNNSEAASKAIGHVATSADELRGQLEGLFNFSADKLLRSIKDQGDALADTFKENGKSAVGFNGQISIMKKGGEDLQSQFEDLNGSLVTAAVSLKNGDISTRQFRDAQAAIEQQFGATTKAAGLTTSQVEGLRAKYLTLPENIQTSIHVDTAAPSRAVQALQEQLDKLPTTKTVTIQTRNVTIAALAETTQKGRAQGGWTSGLTLVGERGPELVDFKGSAFVYTAQQTEKLRATASADRPVIAPQQLTATAAGGRALIEHATIMLAPGQDLAQELRHADAYFRAVA